MGAISAIGTLLSFIYSFLSSLKCYIGMSRPLVYLSLYAAKGIAEKTGGTLIPIALLMDKETIKTDVDVIGIVFPVY